LQEDDMSLPGPDPGIPDDQIFAEANSGDNGTHNGAGQWWLSPDVVAELGGVPTDTVTTGDAVNVVSKAHHRGGLNLNTEVAFDVWICSSTVAIAAGNATKISPLTNQLRISQFNGQPSATKSFTWNVPQNGAGAETAGHRCLVGRVYPVLPADTPSTTDF